jgi:hypothetical protein
MQTDKIDELKKAKQAREKEQINGDKWEYDAVGANGVRLSKQKMLYELNQR